MGTEGFEIPADDGCAAAFVTRTVSPQTDGDIHLRQEGDIVVWTRKQAVAFHAWLDEYIEETAPKLPTTLDSVIRARLRRLGEVWSLTLGEDPITEERYWMRWDGVRIEPEEIEGWAVLFDANSVIHAEEAI